MVDPGLLLLIFTHMAISRDISDPTNCQEDVHVNL